MLQHTPISGQQTSLFTGELSTSLPGDSRNHANPTVQPENDSAKKMPATCGRKCLEQFGRYPRAGLWAKTFGALLIGMEGWYSTRCRLTWSLRATKSHRLYFLLQVSTLPIGEIGCGLLPTPVVNPSKRRLNEENRNVDKNGNRYGVTLYQMAQFQLLPTPQVFDATGTFLPGKHYNGQNKHAEKLGQAVMRLLPTPRSSPNENRQTKLTPSQKAGKHGLSLAAVMNQTNGETSQLNPRFVQEMMGFPSDWSLLPFQSGAKNQ